MNYDPAAAAVRYETTLEPPAWPYSVHEATVEPEPTFTALDWLAALTSHIPNKGEQTVRYYGYYSNKSRGLRHNMKERNATDLSSMRYKDLVEAQTHTVLAN